MGLMIKKVLERSVMDLPHVPVAIRCTPETSLRDAVRTLHKSEVGSIIVAEGLKVVGIFTERDILTKIVDKPVNFEKEKVSAFMTKDPVCIPKSENISAILKRMSEGNFRHLIIVDAYNNLERVISIKDISQYLVSVFQELSKEDKKAA